MASLSAVGLALCSGCVVPAGFDPSAPIEHLALLVPGPGGVPATISGFDADRPLWAAGGEAIVVDLGLPFRALFPSREGVLEQTLVDPETAGSRVFPAEARYFAPDGTRLDGLPAEVRPRDLPPLDLDVCYEANGCVDLRGATAWCRQPCDVRAFDPRAPRPPAPPAPPRLTARTATCGTTQRASTSTVGDAASPLEVGRCIPRELPPIAVCGAGERVMRDGTCVPVRACAGWPSPTPGTKHVQLGARGGDGSGARPYGSVAEALARAPTDAPVLVRGTSAEPVSLNGPVRVEGTCPGEASFTGVILARGTVQLEGLSIGMLHAAPGSVIQGRGLALGGVVLEPGSSIVIDGAVVNGAPQSPAVRVASGATLSLHGAELRGGVVMMSGGVLEVQDSVWRGPGSASASAGARALLQDVRMVGWAGPLALVDSRAELVRVSVEGSVAGADGAALFALRRSELRVDDVSIDRSGPQLLEAADSTVALSRAAIRAEGSVIGGNASRLHLDRVDIVHRGPSAVSWVGGSADIQDSWIESGLAADSETVHTIAAATRLAGVVVIGSGHRAIQVSEGELAATDLFVLHRAPSGPEERRVGLDRASSAVNADRVSALSLERVRIEGGFTGLFADEVETASVADLYLGPSDQRGPLESRISSPDWARPYGAHLAARQVSVRRVEARHRWQVALSIAAPRSRQREAFVLEDVAIADLFGQAQGADPCAPVPRHALSTYGRGRVTRVSLTNLGEQAALFDSPDQTTQVDVTIEDLRVANARCGGLSFQRRVVAEVDRIDLRADVSDRALVQVFKRSATHVRDARIALGRGPAVVRFVDDARAIFDRFVAESAPRLASYDDSDTWRNTDRAISGRRFVDGRVEQLSGPGLLVPPFRCGTLVAEDTLLRVSLPASRPATACP